MQNLISIVQNVINDELNAISVNLLIKSNWEKVFNNKTLRLTHFDKAVFVTGSEVLILNVTIKVIGAAVIFIKSKIEEIKKSIQLLTGVDNVNIILHQVLRLSAGRSECKQCL